MIIVYYDGKCGLCSKEINHYKKIAPAGIFDWQDITENPTNLKEKGISLSDGLKMLHACAPDGSMHVGVDAFILIWQHLNRWRVLAPIVSLPILKQIAGWIYRSFAMWRFNRLDHCQVAAKNDR
ncbi:thiol-disulfide oxidoreductase DCC family protein [Sneathiella sp.]|uniref:thiol-disulfide oxidoreductase DCC family protein n=1 Tax=Sneathiella sp. TaxID=1964365 RepID=UPI0039E4F248